MGGAVSVAEEAAIAAGSQGMEDALTQGTIHGVDSAAGHAAAAEAVGNVVSETLDSGVYHGESISNHGNGGYFANEPDYIIADGDEFYEVPEIAEDNKGLTLEEQRKLVGEYEGTMEPVVSDVDYDTLVQEYLGNVSEEIKFDMPENMSGLSGRELEEAFEQVNNTLSRFDNEIKVIEPSSQESIQNAISNTSENVIEYYTNVGKQLQEGVGNVVEEVQNMASESSSSAIQMLNRVNETLDEFINAVQSRSAKMLSGAIRNVKIAIGAYIALKFIPVVAGSFAGVKRELSESDRVANESNIKRQA